jgi:hypothetical protein
MEVDVNVFNQLDIPFLKTIWFYLAVGAVTVFMKWFKDQDMKIHKRWYLPIALVASYILAALLAYLIPEIVWTSMVINGALIFVGQLIIGDQVVKRFEEKFKQEL